jgi:hypothetical protein
VPCEATGELKQYCSSAIRFSDENIKPLDLMVYCLRGNIRNEGDLNDDGADDISVVTYEKTDWSFCAVFSMRKQRWVELVEEFAVWGGVDENDIQKDPDRKGYIIIRELTARDSICVETRSVKMY